VSLLSYFRSIFVVQPASQPAWGGYDHASGERVEAEDVLALSAAYACIRLIAGSYASLPVVITRRRRRHPDRGARPLGIFVAAR
jgi:phage portal protein BeeE